MRYIHRKRYGVKSITYAHYVVSRLYWPRVEGASWTFGCHRGDAWERRLWTVEAGVAL